MNNYRLINHICFAVLCAVLISTKSFAEPKNIHSLKKELQAYYDSGEYNKEITNIISDANNYVIKQVRLNNASTNPKKLAIVLDIDETSLSYYHNMAKHNFCYNPVAAKNEILTANAPAIKPVLTLYKNALKNKVSIFFVTARKNYAKQATIRNLKSAGYSDWSGLYLRPPAYKKGSIQKFKSETRAMLENKGYTIIASIGDQLSDLEGGHAQKTFKLPNPYYYIN